MGRAGERESGRAGERESGRAGERESGRAGDWESGAYHVLRGPVADARTPVLKGGKKVARGRGANATTTPGRATHPIRTLKGVQEMDQGRDHLFPLSGTK